ncbi:MAG: 16S rRNA (cytosine(1402)-N(4))-methyltransferase RsmH [Bacilli bacterium]|nr:16S rRNA (cytosine(1402)-N(4))-methyltransferase RsmH [Bacilli bacterium]
MEHIPVLLEEVINNLNLKDNGLYVDLTLGRAGHSKEILKTLKEGHLYAFDQDIEAIEKSRKTLSEISSNFSIYHTNFINMKSELEKEGVYGKIDGILMDLGVSSPQLDEDERGFSYKVDAPLDMRMDQRNELSASTIVNTYSYEDIVKILRDYGDERYASSIARNIIKSRPINTTLELVDVIKKSKPMKELKKEGHPAKQAFQAIRIAVNNELYVLKETLKDAVNALAPNGRLLVISFHSGEDKIVKSYFKELTVIEGSRINLPIKEEETKFRLITHKPIEASEKELQENNRSHSAKLRIIERKGEAL